MHCDASRGYAASLLNRPHESIRQSVTSIVSSCVTAVSPADMT